MVLRDKSNLNFVYTYRTYIELQPRPKFNKENSGAPLTGGQKVESSTSIYGQKYGQRDVCRQSFYSCRRSHNAVRNKNI